VNALFILVGLLVLFGTVFAAAESSMSRMTRVRAMALRAEGRRNGALLERIEQDPPRYLNAVYLAVTFVQNGSAILVALIAQQYFESVGITVVSALFTLAYFVVVEAMAKTFGILHSDGAALALAPIVFYLGWLLSVPTRALIRLANVLLPGKGLAQGPFVSEEEIRSMAEVGHEEGVIDAQERELIHSVFTFGDTVVREVMVPRPDIVAIEVRQPLRAALDQVVARGMSRMPVYREQLDHIEGVVYAKDLLRLVHTGQIDTPLAKALRPAHFVPESKRVADLLKDMQRQQFHLAIATDEYGSVSGLVTLEDLIEELVGEIVDEFDREEPMIEPLPDGGVRVNARMPIDEVNDLLHAELPEGDWDTIGGLMFHLLGHIPHEGESVESDGHLLHAERVQGRRIGRVRITPR
jgi:CBS domain containing-hemolysin-like protein